MRLGELSNDEDMLAALRKSPSNVSESLHLCLASVTNMQNGCRRSKKL